MLRKVVSGPVTFKAEGDEGQFKAVFSTMNTIDLDGDVTVPGAFTDGEKVRIAYWGHRWQDLPVGRGEIHSDEKEAWVEGRFFLDTEGGRETYNTVKHLGELQEWSYGFDVLEHSEGEFDGKQVTFLRRVKVHEVSPVFLGAGIGTRTVGIKAGARHTGSEYRTLQEVHDMIVSLGAKCAEGGDSAGDGTGEAKDEAREGKSSGGPDLSLRLEIEMLDLDSYVGG